jgi:hypothetical protein
MVLRAAAALLLLALSVSSEGDEIRPAYLQIRETAPEAYELLWKVPARPGMRLGIYVLLPQHCEPTAALLTEAIDNAFYERQAIACPGGLAESTITIEGLSGTQTDALARVELADGSVQVARLTPAAPSFTVEPTPGALQVIRTYTVLGIEHILLGIDHLLFVLALLLLVQSRALLLWTITAFTLAHSLTLAGATLGLVDAPTAPVEAIIALSIVFVAAEILHARAGRPGLSVRWPWLVAFGFGLLHGFGFAGALAEVGIPQQSIPLALLFFNIGVEAGQLLFIAAALGIIAAFRWVAPAIRQAAVVGIVYAIGGTAMYWTIERIAGSLS